MPNYRNRNRSRNKNKQRNKQQQQQKQQEQQEQQQQTREEDCKKVSEESLTASTSTSTSAPTITTGHESPTPTHPFASEVLTNASAVSLENNVADNSHELVVCEDVQSLEKVPDVTTAAETTTKTTTQTSDTVSNEPSRCDNKSENTYGVNVNVNDNMGNEKSKIIVNQRESITAQNNANQIAASVPTTAPSTCTLGKVIVHRIVCDDSNSEKTKKDKTYLNERITSVKELNEPIKAENENSVNAITQELIDIEKELLQQLHGFEQADADGRTPVGSIKLINDDTGTSGYPSQQQNVAISDDIRKQHVAKSFDATNEYEAKVIEHKISLEDNDQEEKQEDKGKSAENSANKAQISEIQEAKVVAASNSNKQHESKVIVHPIYMDDRGEEKPKITSPTMNEETSTLAKPTTSDVRIVEISDESLSDLEELRSPVVSEAESSIEYSDEAQNVLDSITEVSSSSSTSTTNTQKQSRKQRRIALEHHFLPQMLNPRYLHSISEENSELSDNSENPLSRSASTDRVTNCPTESKVQQLNAKYPKSSLDFSKPHKKSKVIREEPVAVAVSARLQDIPNADESCSTVRSCLSPQAEAAEVVFINSASSSLSDLHDMDLFENIHKSTLEFNADCDLKFINKPVTESICFESLTSSASPPSPTPILTPTLAATISQQQLPEFGENQNSNYKNNQIINNSKLINNNTTQIPHTPLTPPTTATSTNTTSLAETHTDSPSNSIFFSSPANEKLAFAQIEEQISSMLSSINEVATQNTTTATATTKAITSSSSSSPPSLVSSSSSSSSEIRANLANTQNCSVTTTSTTASTRTVETSNCKESFNTGSSLCAVNNAKVQRPFSQDDVNMNTVRDIINNNANSDSTLKLNDLKINTTQTTSATGEDPKKLRLLCTETLASFPYGDVVLEELANVAQNIGESRAFKAVETDKKNMPYPLPELPHIDDLQLSLNAGKSVPDRPEPPPQQEHSWLGVPTTNDPKVLVCLSPSQRSYIQQRPEQKPDDLLDAHQKFVERRGYHEYTKEQLQSLEREKLAEQQLLQTAAKMKRLRKSITPPPPQIPPPPVPAKSSETASKAQNLSKRTVTTTTIAQGQKPNNDVNEQIPPAAHSAHNGEENKHRLLSIMQDTNESTNSKKQKHSSESSSSSSSAHESNSRQTTNGVSAPAKEQVSSTTSTFSNDTLKNSHQFIHLSGGGHKGTANMQSVETTLGQMFPTMGSSNIFDQPHKRFSNIESSNTEPFCSQIMNTQPKRYSSIETHSYETQKRLKNGEVIEDFSTSKHETETTGDKPQNFNSFPVTNESNGFLHSPKERDKSAAHHTNDDHEIMSALNLNKHSSDIKTKRQQQTSTQNEITIKTAAHNNANDESHSAKTNEKDPTKKQESGTYEEFRQQAKAAADAFSTLPSLNSPATASTAVKVTSKGDNVVETNSSTSTSESTKTETTKHYKTTISGRDHEKLFKEFDDLSRQLHRELEKSKSEREQREKSASMFDLNRVHMSQKQQIEEFNKSRYQHLKELEQQIERSMKSRFSKSTRPQEPAKDTVDHQSSGTYEIPIHIENGNTTPLAPAVNAGKSTSTHEQAPPVPKHPKVYQIPMQVENSHYDVNADRFRRAESMFDLSDDLHQRQHTYNNQIQQQAAQDDWSKYASDLGSSENIARPFAKEVEICYQRRPAGIRAPRLTASTNDLSFNNQHSYDQYNAYNVRKHHAPMLNRAPEQSRPKFGSCYSMIERDPNPKYISTTTRRGVSPAPQTSGFFPLDACHVSDADMRQRRASLPRELHEQQLKYIASKEEELCTEFERLQNERRRLMEETQRAQAVQAAQMSQTLTSPTTPTRPLRDHYRSTPKLPTLTEDEVFRQQMAEEWLNKVAEREKRRLQNIIKISKIHEDEASSKLKADMGEEFLSRVKERRHKLAMPSDSDWESGAESQPLNQAPLSEAEDVPPVKVIEGEKEANLRRLPRHLREFAKFSNHQTENIEGGQREEHQEEERSEEATDNSVSRAFKKSSVVKTVKTLRAPIIPESYGHEIDNDNYADGVNRHVFDVSTSNRNTFDSFSNFSSSINPSSSEFFNQFPKSFDEMFGKSPFRSRIHEEFKNYWNNFNETGNKF